MQSFTTSDGLSLSFADEGAGAPLLCLPGLTRNASDFDELAAAVAGRCRVIRLTPRGRGASDRDENYLNYHPAIEARDALELLDHLGLQKAIIVGTSRGGLVAMVIALTAPHRLAGVLLNDIGPDIAPDGLERILGYLGVAPVESTFADAADRLRKTMGEDFPGLSDEKWLQCARRWFGEGPDGLVLNYDPLLRKAFEEAASGPAPDLWPLFDALKDLPLAVVRGVNSDVLTEATLAKMRETHPGVIEATVPDRGHVPFLDEPESLAALDELLARVKL